MQNTYSSNQLHVLNFGIQFSNKWMFPDRRAEAPQCAYKLLTVSNMFRTRISLAGELWNVTENSELTLKITSFRVKKRATRSTRNWTATSGYSTRFQNPEIPFLRGRWCRISFDLASPLLGASGVYSRCWSSRSEACNDFRAWWNISVNMFACRTLLLFLVLSRARAFYPPLDFLLRSLFLPYDFPISFSSISARRPPPLRLLSPEQWAFLVFVSQMLSWLFRLLTTYHTKHSGWMYLTRLTFLLLAQGGRTCRASWYVIRLLVRVMFSLVQRQRVLHASRRVHCEATRFLRRIT